MKKNPLAAQENPRHLPLLCRPLRRRDRRRRAGPGPDAHAATGTPASTQTPARHGVLDADADRDDPDPDADVDRDADGDADGLLHALQHAAPRPRPSPRPCRRSWRRRPRPAPRPTATPRSSRPGCARAQGRKRRNAAPARAASPTWAASTASRTISISRSRPRTHDSPSTTASECDLLDSKAPADVLAGDTPRAIERADGVPTPSNPDYSLATPGAAPIGVPNFFIDKFRIPPFLLPVYQAAGIEYGVRWEVLAAINEIETDYGRNLNVSSAGALGWMQFMPATWRQYGVDANRDGLKDPFNPVDAIFAAARYLRAAGAETDIRKAIFAYNHADWYVDSVLMRARLIGGLPGRLRRLADRADPGPLPGPREGHLRRPGREARHQAQDRKGPQRRLRRRGRPASPRDRDLRPPRRPRGRGQRRPHRAHGRDRAPRPLHPAPGHLRQHVHLRPPRQRPQDLPRAQAAQDDQGEDRPRAQAARARREADRRPPRPPPAAPAAPGRPRAPRAGAAAASRAPCAVRPRPSCPPPRPPSSACSPSPRAPTRWPRAARRSSPAPPSRPSDSAPIGLDARDFVTKPLKKGSRVVAGTILGRIGKVSATKAPHVLFELRPAGRGAPRVDPKPILDGWKLLESTAIYRAKGKNPFFGDDADRPSLGQILLMGKDALSRHVLANPRIDIYSCGARDIRSGAIDRRVLATLEFLAASGLKPTVTSMKCGHGFFTASGNVSQHSSGNAVDIAMVNGIPIIGHQGKGSITDLTIQRLLTLQGTMKPDQIISLMTFEGADNTLAMGDHADHIHVGWKPLYGTNSKAAKQVNAVLKPKQWIKLIDRLKEIDNPEVSLQPSKYSVKATRRASAAHPGYAKKS